MSTHIDQPWVTIEFDAAAEDEEGYENDTGMEVIQPQDEWIDTQGFHSAALEFQVPARENVALLFETAVSPEGPWDPLAGIELSAPVEEQAGDQYASGGLFTDDPSSPKRARFNRYIRWRAFAEYAASGPWLICARWVWVLKE